MDSIVPKVFYKICKHFFMENGVKCKFKLENKLTVVSDPFVEYLDENVLKGLSKENIKHTVAPPHLSPDLVFYQGNENIFGIEIKTSKSKSGDINFNSTPPCGTVLVEVNGNDEKISCYYMFVHLTPIQEDKNEFEIGTMMVVDGDFINSDFELYLEAIGVREKKIDLGSYKDGMDRQRPMFVFPNPLGIEGIRSERSTLISKRRFTEAEHRDKLGLVARLVRDGQEFYAYQAVRELSGPFLTVSRSTETKERTKLKVEI